MTITKTNVEREIRELELRLDFLRQLRAYMGGQVEVPTVALRASAAVKKIGIAATIYRTLAKSSGALAPDKLYSDFSPMQRKSVVNAISLMRRRAHIRDTAKGRIELTTQGLAEAQWFLEHPTFTKHALSRKAQVASDAVR